MAAQVRDAGVRVLRNLAFETGAGRLIVDEMIVAPQGLFAVFAKSGSGQLSGLANSAEWHLTQSSGARVAMANPLLENAGKLQVLAGELGLVPDRIKALVVMTGDVALAASLPPNVLKGRALPYVRSLGAQVLTGPEMAQLVDALTKRARNVPDGAGQTELSGISSMSDGEPLHCPKCGAPLVSHMLHEGEHAGREILRCSRYPACPYASFGVHCVG